MSHYEAPNLDKLSTLDDRGTRRLVYPADATGRWSRLKPWVYAVLIAVYVALPFVHIGGHPAIHIDIADRQFFLFGSTFNAQDFYLAFFLLSGIGFGLIVVAALWGRVWCGWACPQTVFLDGVFRRIERWIEGPAAVRKRRDEGPWTGDKIVRKAAKHAIYVVLAVVIAHVFLAYFTSVDKLGAMITEGPVAHPTTFIWAVAVTVVIYGNFWWFREQLCIVVCPYGRLQSVLQDEDTINVQYDHVRGEPRGKATQQGFGDCVDCRRCVAVCPTGIDIRHGHQLECIGCSYCIDACDEIMVKLNRPTGLIRYDSQRAIEEGGKRRFWRPRVFVYFFAALVGLVVAAVVMSRNDAFEANLFRNQGVPYSVHDGIVENGARIHVVNKRASSTTFNVTVDPRWAPHIILPQNEVTLPTFKDFNFPVVLQIPVADYEYKMTIVVTVTDSASGESKEVPIQVLGPLHPPSSSPRER